MLVFRLFQGAFGAPMIPVAQAISAGHLSDRGPRLVTITTRHCHGAGSGGGRRSSVVIFAEAYDWRWSFSVSPAIGSHRRDYDLHVGATRRSSTWGATGLAGVYLAGFGD